MSNDAVLIDIGLDECRVSMLQWGANGQPRFAHNFELANSQFKGLYEVLEHYRVLIGADKFPEQLGVAFGGSVRGNPTEYSNQRWTFSKAELKAQFGFEHISIVNDVAALAAALPWLGARDLSPICPRTNSEKSKIGEGRYAVIFVEQGLGVAALTHTRHGHEIVDTEAGHATAGPATAIDQEIFAHIVKAAGRVSWEQLLSNSGLVNIHSAICKTGNLPSTDISPLEIVLYGRTGTDLVCRQTLDFFFRALGAFAGDVALNYGAEGGIYIASNIVRETEGAIQKSDFRERFEDKGPFTDFVSAIPTFSIENTGARLIGLSRFVGDAMRERASDASNAGSAQAFSEAMTAVDQTVIVLNSNLKIISVTGSSWGDPLLMEEVFALGADICGSFTALDRLGLLGIEMTGGLPELLRKLEFRESFTAERRLFGGRTYELNAKPTEDGKYVILFHDVTERRRRTKDLEELAQNLRATSSLAKAASRAKSQFLANMSHEIRTPMNGVLGMAEILSQTELKPEQRDMLDTVIFSGNSLLTVINDVLDFSKIEAGKVHLSVRPFNLRSAIEDTVAALTPQADAKHLELIVHLAPTLHENVLGDEGRIRQILTNVIGNAIKFTEEGHVLLDVTAAMQGDKIIVTADVTDTGCGIPQDKLERVFEMFEQVDGSATRNQEGTGLGLAITQRLLAMMDGSISVESSVGTGTKFQMRLALVANPEELAVARPVGNVDLSGQIVLIVDDKALNRQILEEQLRSWGMIPLSVPSGAAALEVLNSSAKNRFALAILDYQMPEMNGITLARAIQQLPQCADMPLLLLTSVGHLGEVDKQISDLFAAVLLKPARTMQLLKKIQELVGNCSRDGELTPSEAAENCSASQAEGHLQMTDVPVPTASEQDVKPDQSLATTPSESPSIPDRSTDALTVLVAEDNAINRKIVAAMLANGGYNVHFACDGREAVSLYSRLLPQIVLMDVSMPNLDGLGATRQIREAEITLSRHAAVIGLTAHALAEDRQACVNAGMDDYLSKPFKRDDLLRMMEKQVSAAGR